MPGWSGRRTLASLVAGVALGSTGCLAPPPGTVDDTQPDGPSETSFDVQLPAPKTDAASDGPTSIEGPEAGLGPDGSLTDAGPGVSADGAVADTTAPDVAPADSSPNDVSVVDTTTPDVGATDTGAPDSTVTDTGVPDTSTPVDTGPDVAPCTSTQIMCGGGCVPNDANNCGACGNVCTAGGALPVCALVGTTYTCTSGCPAATPTRCSGTCVDMTQDLRNCGTCGKTCTTTVPNAQPSCSASTCGHTCSGAYPNDCTTACVNWANDSNNCGSCGNVCSVGTCWNGHCPTAVGTFGDSSTFAGFAIDAANAYAAYSDGKILKCPLSGCTMASTLVMGQPQIFEISASSAGVFWMTVSSNDTVAAGCSPATSGNVLTYGTQPVASGQFQGLSSDANNVYFGLLAATGALDSCPAGGCGSPQAVASSVLPYSIAAASGYVYWVDGTNGTWSIRKCSTGGCAAGGQTLFTATAASASYTDIVADAANVYWVDTALNNVLECPATGCAPSGPITLSAGSNPIAVDASNVYWFTSSALVRCAIGGCGQTAATVSSGLSSPGPAIAVDATNVYWFQGTTLMKLTK